MSTGGRQLAQNLNASPQYDVFISYHWQDHDSVEPVALGLHQRGLSVFLDRWYLTPGLSWMDKLATVLGNCRAAAIMIGAQGLGRWQQRERDLALDRQTRDRKFSVIPVLLPGAEPALDFLGLNTWIDLRQRVDDPLHLEILAKAVRGEAPGPDLQQSVAQTLAEICPYRGLRWFREEDARFFCGREGFIERLSTAVERRHLIAVVGASGSGKSSVVRAGLLPRLRRHQVGQPVYEIATMVPGERPLLRLAEALVPLLEPGMDEIQQLGKSAELAEYLQGKTSLQDVVSRALEKQPGTGKLVLVIDQWEELYTLCRDDTVRQRFLGELLETSASGRITAILTLRGDFYAHAISDGRLAERLQDAVVNLGPMSRDELRRAIEQPARQVGLGFEDGLVDRILDDVGNEPGNLPLLEFVLEMLWRRRDRGELRHEAYVEIGGVRGAIAQRADEIYGALSSTEQETARRTFIRLVRALEGTEDTRRRAILDDLEAATRPVVERFAEARLLVTDRDPAFGKDLVEVSHEALIQRWQKLREWIDADREFLRTRERVGVATAYWLKNQRDPSLLLVPGRPLAEGRDLIEKRRADLDASLVESLQASIDQEQKRLEAERAAEQARIEKVRRDLRRTRFFASATVVLLGVALGFGGYSWFETSQAKAARLRAEAALYTSQTMQSRFLAQRSEEQTSAGNATNGMLLALAALPKSVAKPDRPYVADPESSLYVAIFDNHELKDLRGHTNAVFSAAFSPDGTRIVTASYDKTARVWDARSGQSLLTLQGHTEEVNSAAFSPDGARIVTAADDKTARVWGNAISIGLLTLQGHTDKVRSAAFSPDGARIVTASDDKTARVWDARSGQGLLTLQGHTERVLSAAFSPDGARIVTASLDKTARVWDARGGQSLLTLQGHTDVGTSAAFSPDGARIVTASVDKTARVWQIFSNTQSLIDYANVIVPRHLTATQCKQSFIDPTNQYCDQPD